MIQHPKATGDLAHFGPMLNRPRPRKLINVIKTTSNSTENAASPEEESTKSFSSSRSNSFSSIKAPVSESSNQSQQSPPSVPRFSSPATNSPREIQRTETTANNSPNTRKPIVATLSRKIQTQPPPPAPTFSDSPKAKVFDSPKVPSAEVDDLNNSKKGSPSFSTETLDSAQQNSTSPPQSLSPKSSGEAFLDAADKAADYLGNAFLNSFKGLNLSDTSSVKIGSLEPVKSVSDNDPFADIVKKLKSPSPRANIIEHEVTKNEELFTNLMNEEPPECFEMHQETETKNHILCEKDQSKQQVEPSAFIKAAFSPKLSTTKSFVNEPKDIGHGSTYEPKGIDHDSTFTEVIKSPNPEVMESHTPETIKSPNPELIDSNTPEFINSSFPDMRESRTTPNVIKPSITPPEIVEPPSHEFLGSPVSDTSTPLSSSSISNSSSTGFRASLLKHGLSALERIGKSTADAVVSTRNKLSDGPAVQGSVITPDYDNVSASFYDIFNLYGGYSKLQDLQLNGVRASISLKLTASRQTSLKTSSFDYQSRLKMQNKISSLLHPDQIMELIDDSSASNQLFQMDFSKNFPILSAFEADEIGCVRHLLKSLENIFVERGSADEINCGNRRRHAICQTATVFSQILLKALCSNNNSNCTAIANEIAMFTAQLIKHLQTNFTHNCQSHSRADSDQQAAIKLFLDISYCAVPILKIKTINLG